MLPTVSWWYSRLTLIFFLMMWRESIKHDPSTHLPQSIHSRIVFKPGSGGGTQSFGTEHFPADSNPGKKLFVVIGAEANHMLKSKPQLELRKNQLLDPELELESRETIFVKPVRSQSQNSTETRADFWLQLPLLLQLFNSNSRSLPPWPSQSFHPSLNPKK